MARRLIITVDVEAQPGRAERDHVDRLIWGKFTEGRAGIGELMDIADRHGAKTTMFLDYCEEHLYGSALLDVAREIHRRGHDVQLHAHLDFMSGDWWIGNNIKREYNLNKLDANQAAATFDFLCERHAAAVNTPAVGFRGGGYRFNACVLDALVKRGVILDSSVNVSRTTQPIRLPATKQFVWSNGCLEMPVSCVSGYRNVKRQFDFNFNASSMPTPTSMVEYLDTFYTERGEDAIAVLVMHSWSFLMLANNKFFARPREDLIQRFSEFLSLIAGKIEFVTAHDVVEQFRRGELSLDPSLDAGQLNGGTASKALQSTVSSQMPTCPICGAQKNRFTEMDGRRCPDCGSVERQRAFAVAYDNEIRMTFDVAGKAALILSPSVSELRFLMARGLASKTSVDVRPEAKPDVVADVCSMTQIPSQSRSLIFASYLMPVVYDMNAALSEIARILEHDGAFISVEVISTGRPTVEHYDVATITGWYGKEAYEQYKVGSYRILGEDYAETLRRRFLVSEYRGVDPITEQVCRIFVCRKAAGAQLLSVDDLAVATIRKLAAERPDKIKWLSVQGERLAGLVRDSDGYQRKHPLIMSWRELAISDVVEKVASMGGAAPESADFIYCADTLDFLPPVSATIRSIARVLKPGGAAILTIKSQRLAEDESPPRVCYQISGARYNLPDDVKVASMAVGRKWLKNELYQCGLSIDIIACDGSQEAFVARKSANSVSRPACNICGFDFALLPEGEVNCGVCKSRPRTRTIPLVCEGLKPAIDNIESEGRRRLLAFAMPDSEYRVVSRYFDDIISVSLYGSYREGHITNVDVRDLSGFPPESFDGVFGVLLFDYFVEHDQALAEIVRVLKPGGILFTQIAPYRLTSGDEPPVNTATIQKRTGYFEYVPDGANMPSIKVGRRWLLAAAKRAGFEARFDVLTDPVSGESSDWLIGVKPPHNDLSAFVEVTEKRENQSSEWPKMRGPEYSLKVDLGNRGDAGRVVHEVDLNLNPDVQRIRVTLSGLTTPSWMKGFDFAEHVEDVATGHPQDTLILVGVDAIGVSNDLGKSWKRVTLPTTTGLRLWICFTTATGRHIVQSLGWQGPSHGPWDSEKHAVLFVFDKEWRLLGRAKAGVGYWHGTASIGQSGDTIMFGEYFNNSERYKADFNVKRADYLKTLRPCAIWRSQDDGESWQKTIERGPLEIRHFHTVQPDRYAMGTWWASTGDLWSEVRTWRSMDSGDSWNDVTNPAPEVALPLPSERKRACQRYTDMVIETDRLIWGADDLLGPVNACNPSLDLAKRAGSRIFVSTKSDTLKPIEVGYVGHPVRKFVDVGPGWIVMTEAKGVGIGLQPQVFFLGKRALDLTHLFNVNNHAGLPTGFSYSRGSNRAKNGVFFTFKNSGDALVSGTQCLRWEISFD